MNHGTPTRYRQGCRCDKCVTAMRAYWNRKYHESVERAAAKARAEHQKELRKRRRQGPIPAQVHGTWNGYTNYGCKCELCLEACRARYPQGKAWRDANREELNRKRREYYHNVVKPREAAKEAAREQKRRQQ